MVRKTVKSLFCIVFFFTLFAKMAISIAPIVATFIDSKCVYGVIMQLEIEDDASSKESNKFKKESIKEFCYSSYLISFYEVSELISVKLTTLKTHIHNQTFYPTVPTPPPNI